jgi:hypothetical protein
MLKLNRLALCALAFLPIALTAQTPVPPAAQTQAANDHRADEVAIEQVMNQYHAAILAHDGTALAGSFLPDANICSIPMSNLWQSSRQTEARSASGCTNSSRVFKGMFYRRAKFSTYLS